MNVVFGSSPRGRGTGVTKAYSHDRPRFIPAWAGNSARCGTSLGLGSVHPRVGGEQPDHRSGKGSSPGSSPRGRGTVRVGREMQKQARFIPAWAGNRCRAGQ